jgi:hypothetical protein
MRADVEGCVVFPSFAFVDDVVDAEGLGGTVFPEESATFWLLFFFFAIVQEVFQIRNTAIGSAANVLFARSKSLPKHLIC